jgi:hypothetical protein
VDLSCFFSDRRTERDQHPLAEPADPRRLAEQLAVALQHSSHRWRTELEEIPEKIYLSVDNDDEAVLLQLSADTRYLSPEQIIGLAEDIEATAVQAALDADQPTGIRSLPVVRA